MASYDASINVRVTGTAMVDGVINRVQELEKLVKDINTKPLNLSKSFGKGELADRFGAAAKELNDLKRSFINTQNAVEAFGTTTNRTIANTTALAAAFRQVAANSDVTTNQFREFTVAAQQAAVAANTLGRERLNVLAQELSSGGREGKTIGGGTLVQELLAQKSQIPNSIAALSAYQQELVDLQRLVRMSSVDFKLLEQAIYEVDVALGRGGQFGPALPPGGVDKPKPKTKKREIDVAGIASSAVIGAGFPLLFGQGAGAATGGAIGGLVGSAAGALGGPGGAQAGGFAGSIVGTAVGAAADSDQQIQKLAASLNLAGEAAKSFGESFRKSGADLQTFTQAVNQIRDIAVPFEQQATAIKLAAAVSANYKGSIGSVATALRDVGTTGEVSVGTLTELTKAGVPIVDALAKSFGVSKDAVIKMAAEGKVSVNQLLTQLAQLGNQEKPLTALDRISEAFANLTTTGNKLFGPLLEVLGNALTSALEHVATWWDYLSQVAVPAFLSAVQPVAEAFANAIPESVLQKALDIIVNIGIVIVNSWIKAVQAFAPILAAVITKFKELSNNPVFKFIADQVARLASLLGINTNEVDKFRAKQEEAKAASAKVTEEERQKLAISLQQIALINQRTQALQMMQQVAAAGSAADSASLNASIQTLSAQQQIAASLSQEMALIDQIAAKKTALAQVEYQRVQDQIAGEIAIAQNAYEQAQIKQQGVEAAKQQLDLTIATGRETLRGAEATRAASAAAADLEARMAAVAAYSKSVSSSTEIAQRNLERQANAASNVARVAGEVANANIAVLNTELQSLQAALQREELEGARYNLISQIYEVEVAIAAQTLNATRAQIKAELERVRMAERAAQLEYARYVAILRMAIAQGVVTEEHYNAVRAAAIALGIAQDNLEAADAIANAQWRAADAVYNGAVNAARLRAETERAATAAGNYANAMNSASGGGGGSGGGSGGIPVYDDASYDRAIAALNGGKNPQMVAKAGIMPGYTPLGAAWASMNGFQGNNNLGSPQINISTGPVVQMDGTNYVTQQQFSQGMHEAASQASAMMMQEMAISSAKRRSVGIR